MTYTNNPAIYSYRPLLELERLLGNAASKQSVPKVNIINSENGSELKIAVPGIKKEEIKINIENNILKIESNKETEEKLSKTSSYLIKEFDYSNFKTEYKISDKVDFDKIEAKFSDGILSVFLPYKKEDIIEKTRKIELV
ncbi:MAG: Hsp20/alpha crystallin family protein [Deltaproteobacteria bacterium]